MAVCESTILSAVNNRFKVQFTAANVTKRFQFSKGALDGSGTLNLNINVPALMQPTKVSVASQFNPATYFVGSGATLHIPAGPGGADSPLTLPFSPSQFTAHLASTLPYNPIGLFVDGLPQRIQAGYLGGNGMVACPNSFCSGGAGNKAGGISYFQYSADANARGAYASLATAPARRRTG